MKYLVQVESKRLPVDNVENIFKYLDKIAEDMREKGVQEVDESLNDMKTYYTSNRCCRILSIS